MLTRHLFPYSPVLSRRPLRRGPWGLYGLDRVFLWENRHQDVCLMTSQKCSLFLGSVCLSIANLLTNSLLRDENEACPSVSFGSLSFLMTLVFYPMNVILLTHYTVEIQTSQTGKLWFCVLVCSNFKTPEISCFWPKSNSKTKSAIQSGASSYIPPLTQHILSP